MPPFIFTAKAVEQYMRHYKRFARPDKRCEPCRHKKKACSICKQDICLNDFTVRNKAAATYHNYCKDCANKKRQVKRQIDLKNVL